MSIELILSASPPIFSHNFLADYCYTTGFNTYPFRHHHSKVTRYNYSENATHYSKMPPIRSCLIARDEVLPDHDIQPDIKFCKGRKRVWFADDKGLALTQVRILTEASHCLPRWTDQFFAEVSEDVKSHLMAKSCWEVAFPQPASDYVEFRNNLDQQCISLENVIISNNKFSGTIKVKNISFKKEVFARVTFDRWLSYEDVPASYVPNGLEKSASPFDTFSFFVSIPSSAKETEVIEFCVCYKSDHFYKWDNNRGSNYRIVTTKKTEDPLKIQNFVDPVTADFHSWTDFASSNHVITDKHVITGDSTVNTIDLF
ncbi:protein phosphatase 1 regulatory subunit 3B-like [Limulus polyphemus]|uniref:Protein phosphatase 1 regulatory subunit 3B-like n=1 Tax=Limulus polyphemus TaxID=6850 RepID=A0ABM1BP81_LIMPO|nr:protein phosphatase 1 regulatory subunit 3B-like [Limulus polyphemus]